MRWRVADGDALHAGPASHEVEALPAPGSAGAAAVRTNAPARARELTLGGLAPGNTYQVGHLPVVRLMNDLRQNEKRSA